MSEPFTLVFTCSRSPLSRAIQWWTGERITHVAIGYQFCGHDMLLEAGWYGVRNHLRSKVLRQHDVVAELAPPQGLELGQAMARLDVGYDFANIVGMALVYLLRRCGRAIRNPFGAADRVICSELVLRMDEAGAVEAWKELDRESTSPYRLYQACVAGGVQPASAAVQG